jgi:hypothetical protein
MDPLQPPVVVPTVKIVTNRALWRKVLRDRVPLATSAEQIHEAIEHLPHVGSSLIATRFEGRNFRRYLSLDRLRRTSLVCQVGRKAQTATVVTATVLLGPHFIPRESMESISVCRVEGGKDVAEVIVRRSAIEERPEPPEEFVFLAAEPRDLNEGIGPGQYCEQGQGQANRVNESPHDEAGEEFVVPPGDFPTNS